MSEIVIYQAKDGQVELRVNLAEETVWLTQKQLAELFDKNIRTISEHVGNIFKETELDEHSVIRNFRITAEDGKAYDTKHYNLDVAISVGYRVRSKRGTELTNFMAFVRRLKKPTRFFLIRATNYRKEYLVRSPFCKFFSSH